MICSSLFLYPPLSLLTFSSVVLPDPLSSLRPRLSPVFSFLHIDTPEVGD